MRDARDPPTSTRQHADADGTERSADAFGNTTSVAIVALASNIYGACLSRLKMASPEPRRCDSSPMMALSTLSPFDEMSRFFARREDFADSETR